MLTYAIDLTPDDNGTILATCPDLPIVATFGDDEADALDHVRDAVLAALAAMIDDGDVIPRPKARRRTSVRLRLLPSLKVQLYWALGEVGVTRAELGRRLSWNRESVDRLFRLEHRSRPEQIEAAFAALGREIDVRVREAA